jgi:hypothetical protein
MPRTDQTQHRPLAEETTTVRFLLRDRDSKFTRAFDDVWRAVGVEVIEGPIHAPNANAVAGAGSAPCAGNAWTISCSPAAAISFASSTATSSTTTAIVPTAASTCRRPSSQSAKAWRNRQPPSRSTAAMSSAV